MGKGTNQLDDHGVAYLKGDIGTDQDGSSNHPQCASHGAKQAEISSKFGWGGARENAGGARLNAGGARPGAGRKPQQPHRAVSSRSGWFVFITDGNGWSASKRGEARHAEIIAGTAIARLGFNSYVPLIAVRRRSPNARSWHVERVPMFPGYGFVWLGDADPISPICALRSVRDLLRGPDGRPAHVRDAEIELLQAEDVRRCELAPEALIPLPSASAVRVESGAFEGHLARVVRCDGRVTVAEVAFLGRPIHVLLHRADLREVSASELACLAA